MTTYNPNDFYPRSGAEIDSSGNMKNDADGLNPDGSKNVVTVGTIAPNKANPWTLLATIPYTSFTASGTVWQPVSGLNPAAKKRAFMLANTMNQPMSAATSYFPSDSLSINGTQAINGTIIGNVSVGTLNVGNMLVDSQQYPLVCHAGDSAKLNFPMGATAPTSGNVYIYMREVV